MEEVASKTENGIACFWEPPKLGSFSAIEIRPWKHIRLPGHSHRYFALLYMGQRKWNNHDHVPSTWTGIGLRFKTQALLCSKCIPEFYQPTSHLCCKNNHCSQLTCSQQAAQRKCVHACVLQDASFQDQTCSNKTRDWKKNETTDLLACVVVLNMFEGFGGRKYWILLKGSPYWRPFDQPSMLLCSTDEYKASQDHRPVYCPSLCNGNWGFVVLSRMIGT